MTEEQRAKLEKLARAALDVWEPGTWISEASLEDLYILDPQDHAFIAAANPATALDLLATIARLEAEKVKDGEALEPFARMWSEWPADMRPDDDRHAWGFNGADLTWGDLRAASARLSSRAKDQSQ